MFWTNIIVLLSTVAGCAESSTDALHNDHAYRSVAYYVNWAIYDKKFKPYSLPANNLTHVIYAFANISPETGEVYLSDKWADTEINLTEDQTTEIGNNVYGCLEQLFSLKRTHRQLKVLLSIGGASYSSNFANPASTSSGRSTFVLTAISLVKNLGLDGLDINWENITTDEEAQDMVLLLKALRDGLDTYGNSLSAPYHFTLTVASPADASHYRLVDMDQYLDFWNLMAYDYAGSWSQASSDQANLFRSSSNPASTPFDTETIIYYYSSHGIANDKIVLGIPLYGRSFENTTGLGAPCNGVGNGTGVYDVKDLPLAGAMVYYSNMTASSYSYDAAKKQLISYDNSMVAKQKAHWIKEMGLGGAMWWESSSDGLGDQSLIWQVAEVLDGDNKVGLERSFNQLAFPDSTYNNIRAGMLISTQSNSSTGYTSMLDLSPSTSTLRSTRVITVICGTDSNTLFSTALPTTVSFSRFNITTSSSTEVRITVGGDFIEISTVPAFTTTTTSTTVVLAKPPIPTVTVGNGISSVIVAGSSSMIVDETGLGLDKQLDCPPRLCLL